MSRPSPDAKASNACNLDVTLPDSTLDSEGFSDVSKTFQFYNEDEQGHGPVSVPVSIDGEEHGEHDWNA
jgi:hypothetical protein